MSDPQFQPGQPTPPTQGGGVFGGNPEEIVHDISMFGPLQQAAPISAAPEVSPEHQNLQKDVMPFGGDSTIDTATSPFDGYVLPQEETPVEEVVKEPEIVLPPEMPVEEPVKVEVVAPVIEEETPVAEEETPVAEEETPGEEPITIEVVTPVVEEATPVVEEATPVVEEETPIQEPIRQPVSDIQQKFTTLLDNITELNGLLRLKNGEVLEIIGSNNEKTSVLYQFGLNEQHEVHVKRIETEKNEDETTFNELKLGLNPESHFFEIFLDDILLFEESDLLADNKKKSQVVEKLNKFIFLTESKLKDAQKELRAKQEEEEERRRLQDIFRNF